jgi:membrane-associated phospholipid phosphatase
VQNSSSELGLQLVLFLQSLGDWLVYPMRFFTFLGQEEFFLLVMPAILWCISMSLGLRIGLILLLADNFRIILKLVFTTPRPYWVSAQVRPLDFESSFGFPSGHATDAAAVWGMLATQLRRPFTLAALGLMIFLNGLSRVYLGVHFISDVLGGWVLGFLLLWLFLRLEKPVLGWFNGQKVGKRLAAAFALSLAFVLVGVLVRYSLGDWQMPAEWLDNAAAASPEILETGPLSLSELMTSAGAMFGLAAGAIWLASLHGFDAGGPWGQRLLRYPVGLVGVILLWYGLGAVLPRGDFWLAYALRYMRYFLIGFWVSGLAPFFFIRLGLAQPARLTLPSQQPIPSGGR